MNPSLIRSGVIVLLPLLFAGPILRAGDTATVTASGAELSAPQAAMLLPEEYRPQVIKSLSVAEKNAPNIISAIVHARPAQRPAMAFLIANMPDADLQSVGTDLLVNNVTLALAAREQTPWGKEIPDELFNVAVLPYANVNEKREDWRTEFFAKWMPVVKDCKTIDEAVFKLNVEVFKQYKVSYHATKRPKPDQSPSESIAAGYASCTGLSIMLIDACRAVSIPARFAGVPQWTGTPGNHSWAEVWDGRQWRMVGACEPAKLDEVWFGDNAKKADASKPENRIYAATFGEAKTRFPLVWAPQNDTVPAVDVTAFYTDRRKFKVVVLDAPGGKPVKANITLRANGSIAAAGAVDEPTEFILAAGQTYEAEITRSGEKPVTKAVVVGKDAKDVIEIAM